MTDEGYVDRSRTFLCTPRLGFMLCEFWLTLGRLLYRRSI